LVGRARLQGCSFNGRILLPVDQRHYGGMSSSEPEQLQIPVLWVGLDELPVMMANQLISQVGGDEITLAFGMITPPVLLGSPEEQHAQAGRIGYIPVRPVARLGFTRQRLGEFIKVLSDTADNYDRGHGGTSP
jgi:hypothetical protein